MGKICSDSSFSFNSCSWDLWWVFAAYWWMKPPENPWDKSINWVEDWTIQSVLAANLAFGTSLWLCFPRKHVPTPLYRNVKSCSIPVCFREMLSKIAIWSTNFASGRVGMVSVKDPSVSNPSGASTCYDLACISVGIDSKIIWKPCNICACVSFKRHDSKCTAVYQFQQFTSICLRYICQWFFFSPRCVFVESPRK